MLKNIEIKNFRCFRDLYLHDLKRFNIVVGESGSGKTALLEAIFLAGAASPEIWMRLRQWRGFAGTNLRLTGSRVSYEGLFRDIFFNFEKRKPVRIDFTDSDAKTRTLKISYPSQEKYSQFSSQDRNQENEFIVEPIVFAWRSKGREQKARVEIKDHQLSFRGFNNVYPIWFSSPMINEGTTIAQSFSELSVRKRTEPLIKAVRALYPELESIGVESIAGDLLLCVSSAAMSEKLPIGLMSSGLTRFLSIMVAIAVNPGGVLLIDEFEVGFYYKTLRKVLQSICAFCIDNDVQIVASTHSYEFIQTLLPIMEAQGNDFNLLRAERHGSECKVKVLSDPVSAIESNFEVR